MKLVAPMSSLATMDDVYKADGFAMVTMIVVMEGKKKKKKKTCRELIKNKK
jgi:hypothetical protein